MSGDAAAPRAFEILEQRRVHDGFYGHDLLTLRHTRFGGGWTPPLRRELVQHRRAVVVLPYDARRDRVVLIEQFRTGAVHGPGEPWLIEAPAGLTEPGEAAEAVARRELAEECGLEARRLERACGFFASPGGSDEWVELFVAEAEIEEAGGLWGAAGEDEDIRSHVLAAETAFAWRREGRITGMPGLVALLWLELNRDRLRRLWGA